MNQHISEILQDLYRLDPELKKSETQLVPIIEKLLAARPDTGFDDKFRTELRAKVLAELGERAAAGPPAWKAAFNALFGAPRAVFAVGGAALGVLLMIALFSPSRPILPGAPTDGGDLGLGSGSAVIQLGLGPKITAAGRHAFGSLAAGVSGESAAGRDGSDAAKMAAPGAAPRPVSDTAVAAAAPPLGLGGGGGMAGLPAPDTMPSRYQPPVGYDFKYPGQLDLSASEVEVLMREKSFDSKLLAAMVGRVDLGLMDLSRLNDLNVQNITLVEDKEFGYWVNVNFDDGSVNISQNWQRWPQPYAACAPGAECLPPRLQLADIPADEELIRIAADFVSEMGISTESYGQPRVDNSWRYYYETAENKADYWFPDQLTVEYPLLINGMKVYNGDGRTVGMMVGVDVRNRRAANISPIYVQKYVSSAYDAVTDAALVSELIAKGGVQQMYSEGADKMVTLELAEPERAFYSHWIYANGRSENVLVPALVFPIKDKPQDGSVWLEKVVVPLARDVLVQNVGVYPVLMMKDGAVGTAAPETASSAPADLEGRTDPLR